jgi:hypothetical protein
MNKKLVNSQLTNALTYTKVRRKMVMLASNVFNFKNLEEYAPNIDKDYINRKLVYNGAVAWFYDEELGLLALPFNIKGKPDVYGNPTSIEVIGSNGYHKSLSVTKGEAIIMYDNSGRYPLINDIIQDAERIALCKRVQDVNISMQKNSRIWKTDKSREKTVKDLLNRVDGNVENVVSYDNVDIDTLTSTLAVVPYIANDIDEHIRTLWEEFYAHIGISSVLVNKKERLIKDEMRASQGGTIASRFIRFTPRVEALTKINKKWNVNIELEYYDGLPTTLEDVNDTPYVEEEEVVYD